MFEHFKNTSIIGRAIADAKVQIHLNNIRDYSTDKHHKVDDMPYGGGPGMVMTPQPLDEAIQAVTNDGAKVIYMTPKGQRLDQNLVNNLSQAKDLVIVCGHYEGVDQRVIDKHVDYEISIGDYVLTGGELPAMVLMDAIIRTLPGVLGDEASYQDDSHYNGLLEYPQYTRPQVYDDMKVPDVLLSGHHQNIDEWRLQRSIQKTIEQRPDLIKKILKDENFDQNIKQKILNQLKK
jgi:tRNA (guanine37-N1)-methyltransferase